MKNSISRRDFLRLTSLITAALAVQPLNALSISDPWNLSSGSSQKVIVLGAGMSGLSAAMELQKLGHQVQILEGQMRAGGRVFTARNMFADGMYADVGAARIPSNHEWTMKYIKQYGLQLIPFQPTENDFLHVVGGKKIRYTSKQQAPLKDYPVSLTAEEVAMGWEGISTKPLASLMANAGNPADLNWPPATIAPLDKLSFKEYLISQKFSAGIADLLMLGWEEKSGLNMSILELIREEALSFGAVRNKIAGGNDLLPRAMANQLGDIIQYGMKVVDVRQDESGVTVTVLKDGEQSTLKADRVICTFALPILRKMEWIKTLSPQKQKAIKEMGAWNLSRTVVQVSDRYWKKEGYNGFAATDEPSEIWDPHYESTSKRGMIAAYIKHTDSELFLKMSDAERYSFSAKHINSVFPGLEKYKEGAYTKVWGEDPWAGYANVMGGRNNMTQAVPYLIKAEGRIHFAGEHASAYHGWINGAIESGNRAAKEVNSF
ncbi:flavin monoamine oxidase family protein [soil metagenome]